MKKSLVALAALAAFAGAASAQSSVTLYGIIDLGLVKQNNGDIGNPVARGTNLPAALQADATWSALGGVGMDNEELNVNQATKSRIGFRGVEDLGGGLTAKFDIEHRFRPDTGSNNQPLGTDTFWDKAIVGLAGGFGEVTLGRDYMPAFYPQYLLDPWLNQGIAELGGTSYAFAGYVPVHSARYNNGVFYKTPNMSGFTAMVGASMSEVDGVDNRYGINVMYTAGPLFLAATYDQAEAANGETNSYMMVGGAYDFGFVKPRVSYAQSKINTGNALLGEIEPTSLIVAATFPIGTNLIKVGYTQMEWDNEIAAADLEEVKQRKFSLGYELNLSKRTAIYTDITSGKTKDRDTVTGIDVGVRHLF